MTAIQPIRATPLPPSPPRDRYDWPAVRRWRVQRRALLLEQRAATAPATRQRVAARVMAVLDDELPELRGMAVGLYWPFRGEIDLRALAGAYSEPIQDFALPVVVATNRPLEFWRWWPGMQLSRGVWGITVPAVRDVVTPAALIVPLVGYDADGYRLGYGGGYYDRTLAAMSPRPLAVGVGYAAAGMETICPQAHDMPMDVIVTDSGLRDFRAAADGPDIGRTESGPSIRESDPGCGCRAV